MRLLFVEDDSRSVAQVKQKVEGKYPDIECYIRGFADAKEWIAQNYPDIVSLDLLSGGLSGDPNVAGQEIFDCIWKERFCPIIVYSAHPELDAEKRAHHPFVRTITKGRGSPQKFADAIDELRPQIKSIQEAELRVRKEFSLVLREVAPYAYDVFSDDPEQRDNAILRCGRRRLAALMDDLSRHGPDERLASWEQYICPPVSNDTQLGDILQRKDAPSDEPGSYLVVLTPSCDLVASAGRTPKIKKVLAASCCSMREGLAGVGMPLKREIIRDTEALESYRSQLKRTILNQGYYQKIIPLPRLQGRIPTMAVDLRALDLIPIGQIGLQETEYVRVASLDSPFRELVSWAYLQIACRPALPDRDGESWCDDIVASCRH
jgi:hypothetical protein